MSQSRTDRILAEWSDVVATATPPPAPVVSLGPRVRGLEISLVGAGLLLIVVALAWLAGRPDGPNVGDTVDSTPEPSAVAPSPNASLNPSAAPGEASVVPGWTCPRALTFEIEWERVADRAVARVFMRNRDSDPCEFGGVARVDYGMNDGTILVHGSGSSGAPGVIVQPGQTVTSLVTVTNYCGPAPIYPLDLDFHIVGGGEWVVGSPEDQIADATPPCVDPDQSATTDMQPWTP